MKVHVNICNDFSIGALSHNAIQVPMPVPVINFSIEMIATQLWTLGYLANQNKFAKKVRHKYMWICQDGHDCGMMIPDVTLPIFANLMYVVIWPFSQRKMVFSASKVKIEGQPTACAQTFALPPLPMMTCGDPISAPTAFVMNNVLNTVKVGITWTDIALGMLDIAVSIAIDALFECLTGKLKWGGASGLIEGYKNMFSKGAKEAVQEASEKLSKAIAEEAFEEAAEMLSQTTGKSVATEFIKKLIPIDRKSAAKRGAGVLGGLVTSSAKGNPTAKVGVGGPMAGAEVGHDFSKGETTEQYQGMGHQKTYTHKPDGTTEESGARYGESL